MNPTCGKSMGYSLSSSRAVLLWIVYSFYLCLAKAVANSSQFSSLSSSMCWARLWCTPRPRFWACLTFLMDMKHRGRDLGEGLQLQKGLLSIIAWLSVFISRCKKGGTRFLECYCVYVWEWRQKTQRQATQHDCLPKCPGCWAQVGNYPLSPLFGTG